MSGKANGRAGRAVRHAWGTGAAVALAGLLSPQAHAAPELPRRPTAALHVGKKALDLIGAMALEKVPSHIDLPPVDKDLMTCPGGAPIQLHVRSAYVDLTPKSLTFTPADGALTIDARLDLEGFAQVEITRGYGCLGTAICNIGFRFTDLNPRADVSLSITDGKPKAGIGAVTTAVAAGGAHLDVSGCIVENFTGGLLDKLAEKLIDHAGGPLGDRLGTAVPPLVEAQLGSMLGRTGMVQGYGFNAAITDVKMTADGIDAYAAIGVGYEGTVAECVPPDAAPTLAPREPTSVDATLALPRGPTSSVMVGVSTDLLSSALNAAWRAGMLCTDDAAIAKLGFDPSKMAKLVPGMPAGMTMHFAMGLDEPPVVTEDGKGSVRMRVRGAELLMSMAAPGEPTSGVAIATDFSVGVRPSVDAVTGMVYAELTDLSMERMEMHGGLTGKSYALDPERLAVLMRDIVLPMASARLRGMPLAPAAFGMAGIYGWLTEVAARNGGLFVGLEAYRRGPAAADTQAPDTLLVQTPGALVRAGMARFQVSGTDDTTPSALLRYQWQVDEGPLSQPVFAREIAAPVTESGKHTFRVRAVDLFDKPASGFVQHAFELDAVAPTLEILEEPDVSVRKHDTRIRLTASDDRSPANLMSFAYRIEAREPGGEMHLVDLQQPSGMEDGVAEVNIGDLQEGTAYEVTVLVYDQAGNVTSQRVGFVAANAGCSVSGGSDVQLGSTLLISLALFIATRRRPPRIPR